MTPRPFTVVKVFSRDMIVVRFKAEEKMWTASRLRKARTCAVTGNPLRKGERAWRQLGNGKNRSDRVGYYEFLDGVGNPRGEAAIMVKIEGKERVVERKDYVRAKTAQLREFGYTTLEPETVDAEISAILAKEPLSVIGKFMEDEVLGKVREE